MQAGSVMGNLASVVDLPSEEAALVAELKAGSEPAFAELIARYHQPSTSLIARNLQDPADASDITQEVFIKVFRNIRSFHGDASLRTWLYRIALHEASNQRRWWSRHKRQEIAMDGPCCSRCDADADGDAQSLGASLADSGCSPFDYAAQAEVRERGLKLHCDRCRKSSAQWWCCARLKASRTKRSPTFCRSTWERLSPG